MAADDTAHDDMARDDMAGDDTARVDGLLAAARRTIEPRATVADLDRLVDAGALVVDTRPIEQRERDGEMPGALVIDRNVLEWRLDPTSAFRIAEADDTERTVVVVCNEGYASSLAAATLRTLGLANATDLDGGYQAWRAAGLPTT
jgi:rhodanese-related sulfurtransferase